MKATGVFNYTLPPELIAQTAAEPRDAARLLCWPGLEEKIFRDLPDLLEKGDLLVMNASRVIPARLLGTRPGRVGEGKVGIEVLLHRPLGGDLAEWEVLVRPARRLKDGDEVSFGAGLKGVVSKHGDGWRMRWATQLGKKELMEKLEKAGTTPLPPYIKTADSAKIRARYQTVYAETAGSVAAPTAGLHFTPELLRKLEKRGIQLAYVTLHVGAGTFMNPTAEQIAKKELHAEWAELGADVAALVKGTKAAGGKVVAVGTTACRTLESWGQAGMADAGFMGETRIFIQPGYDFTVVDRLVTNFHLPGSSLLMLVEALIGKAGIEAVYEKALAGKFRFFSFGDTSLLTRKGA